MYADVKQASAAAFTDITLVSIGTIVVTTLQFLGTVDFGSFGPVAALVIGGLTLLAKYFWPTLYPTPAVQLQRARERSQQRID